MLRLIILHVFAFLCFQGGPELTGIPLVGGGSRPLDYFIGFRLDVNNPLLLDRRLPLKPEVRDVLLRDHIMMKRLLDVVISLKHYFL